MGESVEGAPNRWANRSHGVEEVSPGVLPVPSDRPGPERGPRRRERRSGPVTVRPGTGPPPLARVLPVIVVVAALKGGVGKTTTSVYLSAVAVAGNRTVTLVDSDPQASAADWVEHAADEVLGVDRGGGGADRAPPRQDPRSRRRRGHRASSTRRPGHERLLAKALERADAVVIPTRVGGVETARVEAVLDMVPEAAAGRPRDGSARTFTRDYQDTVDMWVEAGVPVWGAVPERVGIATGPGRLAVDRGLGLLPRGRGESSGARCAAGNSGAHRGVRWGHGRWTR